MSSEKTRIITEVEYQFFKKMLHGVQDYYNWAKENRDEPREATEWVFEGISNDVLEAVEFAFENDLVED